MPKVPLKSAPQVKNKKDVKENLKSNEPVGKDTSEKQPSSSPGKRKKLPERPVVYPDRECFIFDGKDALTDEKAKKFLGWQEESENIKFGSDYLIKDEYGRKVRMTNNLSNRPLSRPVIETLKMEILRGNWEFNFENIIVGKTGMILNGQHTLIALVLAGQTWDKDLKWRDTWRSRPTIEKSMGVGVEETDKVINTMDTCKPRDLRDVVYRSQYLKNVSRKTRIIVAKILSHAINHLWHRTGASLDAYAPRRTHSEAMHFLDRHERLLEAVTHVSEENCDGHIGKVISPGYAAAMMYLMAACKTESENEDKTGYSQISDPSEDLIDFTMWEKASEFWVFIGQGTEALLPVKEAVIKCHETGGATLQERTAIVVKAWNLWSNRKKVTVDSLSLAYEKNEDGIPVLAECPIVGGIDLGNPKGR